MNSAVNYKSNLNIDNLAIIIPAFKYNFFDQTLNSISNQTNKNFTLYIGDDCSPDNLKSICDKYQSMIDMHFVRFDENWGSKSLVEHWDRCIDLSNEKWIWLFSDDDLMDENCVENFYKTLEETEEKYDVYRFEVSIINDNGYLIKECQNYKKIESSADYVNSRFHFKNQSCVTNSIFRRDKFLKEGRFEKFNLAWGSDDALWIKLAFPNGIFTQPLSKISFRMGNHNISNDKSLLLLDKKIDAQYQYVRWLNLFFKKNEIEIVNFKKLSEWWFYNIVYSYKTILPFSFCMKMIRRGQLVWSDGKFTHIKYILMHTLRILKNRLKVRILVKNNK